MKRVLIYNSPQVSKRFNLQQLLLQHVLPGTGMVGHIVTADTLCRAMTDDTDLFIIPGANASSKYREELSGDNLAHLRHHMQRGMRLLGLCAGSYVLSRAFDFVFHDDASGAVREHRHVSSPLGVVDAHAYGPDLRLYDPPAPDGSLQLYNAVTLKFGDAASPRQTRALISRAPSFRKFDEKQCQPMAHYEVTGEAAILRFDTPGFGQGVLSGPSIEVGGGGLASYVQKQDDPRLLRVMQQLDEAESSRRELVAQVFDVLLPQAAPQIRRNLGLGIS